MNDDHVSNESNFDVINETDDYSEKFYSRLSIVFASAMLCISLAGVVFNLTSLYVFTRKSFRKRSINVLLCGLSLSDLCLCILAIPVFSLAQVQTIIPDVPLKVTSRILVYAYPIVIISQTASVWTMVAVSIDRYLAVCHPFSARLHSTTKRAFATVCGIVVFSIAYNFIRFWEYKINDEPGVPEDKQILGLLREEHWYMLWYQNVAMLITQFAVPLVVLSVLNCLVARTILKAGEMRRELVASERREFNTSRMMMYYVVVFLFCYMMSFCLNVAEVFNGELFKQPLGFVLNDANNILVAANSSSSFFFYVGYSSRYRAQLRQLPFVRIFVRRCCMMSETTKYSEKSEKTNDYTTLVSNYKNTVFTYNVPTNKDDSMQFLPEQQAV
ncbi:FMRFamide receptor [Aphelenchoides besseyi]|nr:FMRFamide receptor [Aphelenchoides besseyi]